MIRALLAVECLFFLEQEGKVKLESVGLKYSLYKW